MISPANTNPRITDEFTGVAYRLVGRDDVQGVVAADFASKNLQAKTAYVLNDQTAYGEGLATVFRDQAQKDGINVVGFAGTQETSAFDAVLTPILAANPDVVFFGGIYDRAGPLLQQMRERGIQAKFLGGDGLDSSDLARLAGDAVVGANYVTVSGPASAYPEAAQFVKDYQQAYNAPAGYPAFQSYDAVKACMLGIANAAKAANGRPTRQQVQEGMKQVKSFDGVTGNVTFDEKGDRSPATYYIFEAKSADPAQWNTNEVVAQVKAEPPKK
jgi:ABC-type branched-subunit amino acid transport system substrate-binding protein